MAVPSLPSLRLNLSEFNRRMVAPSGDATQLRIPCAAAAAIATLVIVTYRPCTRWTAMVDEEHGGRLGWVAFRWANGILNIGGAPTWVPWLAVALVAVIVGLGIRSRFWEHATVHDVVVTGAAAGTASLLGIPLLIATVLLIVAAVVTVVVVVGFFIICAAAVFGFIAAMLDSM